jgi:hypothetical protein
MCLFQNTGSLHLWGDATPRGPGGLAQSCVFLSLSGGWSMKSDKPLYLVASRPGAAARAEQGRRSHLRLVHPVSPGRMSPGPSEPRRTEPAIATTSMRVVVQLPPELLPAALALPPRRSLSRPRWQRLLQAASDVALLFVAVLIGLRPNA